MIDMPTCNKIPFATKAEATDYMAICSRDGWSMRYFKSGRVYHCPQCSQWHLTQCSGSRDKKLKRARRNRRKAAT